MRMSILMVPGPKSFDTHVFEHRVGVNNFPCAALRRNLQRLHPTTKWADISVVERDELSSVTEVQETNVNGNGTTSQPEPQGCEHDGVMVLDTIEERWGVLVRSKMRKQVYRRAK